MEHRYAHLHGDDVLVSCFGASQLRKPKVHRFVRVQVGKILLQPVVHLSVLPKPVGERAGGLYYTISDGFLFRGTKREWKRERERERETTDN